MEIFKLPVLLNIVHNYILYPHVVAEVFVQNLQKMEEIQYRTFIHSCVKPCHVNQ